ncbi:TadE/TadG family type IV pilus assembly protein [Citricoccus sp. SGAir0253]|uniref:TadE/TadG family type IV pilus assembly protein n=1 Tax=Citricoccus sp. SGAir0253 TaxID=2567881 RepID=UPI001AEF98BB|nr:TadE/TadG family type IV pilus assembly protein [Citricoccus sp. SGAir0253]
MTSRLGRRLRDEERGTVSVLTAFLMVALLGFTAIVVDVGLLYFERAQLQNGADAGALAIAQDCALGTCPGDPQGLAIEMASDNANDDDATADPPQIDLGAGRVRVTAATPADNPLALAFAPVVQMLLDPARAADPDFGEAILTADAEAGWFVPTGGPRVLPLAISWCQFEYQLDAGVQVIRTSTNPTETVPGCPSSGAPGYSGTGGPELPGGFGWLDLPDSTVCGTSIDLSGLDLSDPSTTAVMDGNPGNDVPNACRDDLYDMLDEPVLVPIFTEVMGAGMSGQYRIIGFASFQLHGWNLSGSRENNTTPPNSCVGTCRGIIGEFVSFVTLDAAEQDYDFGPNPLDLGTRLVTLVD